MQLPQISIGHASVPTQSGSAQSTSPSPSLSTRSSQISEGHPATSVCVHAPAGHASVVQASPSLQSAAVLHGTQPGIVVIWQLLLSPHTSVVQALSSLQSSFVSHGMQPGTAVWPQMPSVQCSVVQT